MKSYKDLEIYRLSYELAIRVHKLSVGLPKYELFEEGSQIRRSSKGIASCIVEGYARKKYKAELIKYLLYAHGSCDETIVHLSFLRDTHDGVLSEGIPSDSSLREPRRQDQQGSSNMSRMNGDNASRELFSTHNSQP